MPLDKITADSVLLVEGKDEIEICTLLLNAIKPGWKAWLDIQPMGGKAGLVLGARAIAVVSGFDRLKKLAVIVDADDDPLETTTVWASEKNDFDDKHLPKEFHYLVLPASEQKGALEAVFLQSIPLDNASFQCVKNFMGCISDHTLHTTQAQKDKLALMTYTNTHTRTPSGSVGFAMTKDAKDLFDFKNPAFKPLVDFLESLF